MSDLGWGMAIAESFKAQIRAEWEAAAPGVKSMVVRRWAETLSCSYQTVYRALGVGRKRKGERLLEGIEQVAQVVAQIKKRPPKDAGEIATDQAVRIAVENGCIPAEMGAVSIATFNRVMRDCGLNKRPRRVQRFQAEYPNQLHHVDASSSQFFYVHRKEGDDYILRMHGGSARGYKNKPVPIRERPWLYGLADDHSGYHLARYTVALGESLMDNLRFLAWAWGKTKDKPFFGVPERIKADQGPLMKGAASKEWLDRLGIEPDGSMPGEKESHGKIERPWRTLWGRFERLFFVEADWKKFEITLSELNRRFRIYQDEEYNLRAHRFEKGISRLDAWRRINLRGGAVALPENAIATVARIHVRTVDQAGCFSLDGESYEVKGLHAAKVRVYEGVFEDKLVVEEIKTGEKYEVKRFKPTPLDTFVGHKETAHQVAVRAAETLELRNTLYTERKAADAGGNVVIRIQTRVKEVRAVENPLDADSFSSIEAAMREFLSICPLRLDAENRQAVREMIIEHGLSRSYVRELALEVQGFGESVNG